jgi:hypothetical protein
MKERFRMKAEEDDLVFGGHAIMWPWRTKFLVTRADGKKEIHILDVSPDILNRPFGSPESEFVLTTLHKGDTIEVIEATE